MATKAKAPVKRSVKVQRTGNRRPPLSPDLLKRMYFHMLRCRMSEQRAMQLLEPSSAPARHFAAIGLEATEVGAAIDLQPRDSVAPSERSLAAQLIKGTPLRYIYARLLSDVRNSSRNPAGADRCGCVSPNGADQDFTIAAELNIGTGMALAYRMQKRPNVVLALSGGGSASFHAWHEALAFGALHKLPILYVIENNRATTPAIPESLIQELSIRAQRYGFPVMTVDGNDVVAVYRVCYEARERARQGYGPTLVECRTYRPDSCSQSPQIAEELSDRDPIRAMERYLQKQNLCDDRWKERLIDRIKLEIHEAVDYARKGPEPLPDEAVKMAYSL